MRDVLDLNLGEPKRSTRYSGEIEQHGNILKKMTDLKEKLNYYNRHICTLCYTFNPEGLHCYGDDDQGRGEGEIFFNKEADKNNAPGFELYLEVRQQEIDRLKGLIESKQTYTDKLTCFIEQKAGQHRYDELKVHTNEYEKFLAYGAGTVPPNLLGDNDVIDLKPASPEERKGYNLYIRKYVERLIEDPTVFYRLIIHNYYGFLCEPAIRLFTKQVNRALKPKDAVEDEVKRIETKFFARNFPNYPERLYPYSIENYLEWESALFNAFINGHDYDFSRRMFSEHEMKAFIHVEQIFEYYKKVLNLKLTNRDQKNVLTGAQFGLDLIRDELHTRLIVIEGKILSKIERWKQGFDKIECAAFCELLFDKKYFVKGSTRIKTVNAFACSKYGNPIKNQLGKTREPARKTHKTLLSNLFK
ncbi:MAG: hypothetical protein WKF97_13975 [Chitinophagaceae bacterium]